MVCKYKSTKLNGSKYYYVSLKILLKINHLFIQLNDQTVLLQIIPFSISHLFALFKCLTLLFTFRCYHSGLEWTWEWWQWRGALHFPKLIHYWNLTIRLFSVISRTLVEAGGGSYPSVEMQLMYSTASAIMAEMLIRIIHSSK